MLNGNAAWTDETPFEKSQGNKRQGKLNRYVEGALGGPVRRDRVWFFLAARDQCTADSTALPESNASIETLDESTCVELKEAVAVRRNDAVQVAAAVELGCRAAA